MKFYIPTYKDCLDISNNNPKMCFYESKFIIDNYKISIFGYRYAKYNNFILPIIDNKNINALELKGISYVFNDDGSLYDYNLMLHKFWELDQYKHISYDCVKSKKINNINIKEDGFLITFIRLPNGVILSQSKKGFSRLENIRSNEFLKNEYYYNFINYCIDKKIQPIFEYVNSQFYVKYEKEDLILIKLRDKNTGRYIDINNFNTYGISVVKNLNYSIDELIEMKNINDRIEGWIVQFDDDDMVKIKTSWWKNEKILRLLNK